MAASDKSRFPIPAATAQAPHLTQLLIRKSRFLAQSCHCATKEASREFIELIRKAHPDATHNCWAYVAGSPGDSAQVGSSDDGEPRGTAGRPMLSALLHCGIGQICVVVSRWFGGIKLGTGGLVRAYQDSVAENIASLPVTLAIAKNRWQANIPYSYIEAIKRILPELEAKIETEDYGQSLILRFTAPEDRDLEVQSVFAQASNGGAKLQKL